MNQSPRPDETPNNLQEQLLLEQAKAGRGKCIINGATLPLRDAPRLTAIYGGSDTDWDKMTTTQLLMIDGASVQVHWYRNRQTGQDVEFKFKREYPKISLQN